MKTDKLASQRMKANSSTNTGPELILRQALRDAGMTGYRLHHLVPGRPDIAFVSKRIAIFVNGCFWHDCPKCKRKRPKRNADFWEAKISGNVLRDAATKKKLKTLGWRRVIAWECEIRKNPNKVVRTIKLQIAANRLNSGGKRSSGA